MHDTLNQIDYEELSKKMINPSLIACMTIQVQIIRGKDLIPKDRPNRSILTGMKKLPAMTSDPYVKVRYKEVKCGKTRVIPKNCVNPEWNETIRIEFNANQARNVLHQIYHSPYYNKNQSHISNGGSSSSSTNYTKTSVAEDDAAAAVRQAQILLGLPTVDCFIYDKDVLSFDDPMGIVQIPITLDHIRYDPNTIISTTTSSTSNFGPQWYAVCTNQVICNNSNNYIITNKEFCKNVSGELYVNIQVKAQWMMHIQNNNDIHKNCYSFSSSGSNDSMNGRYDVEIAWTTEHSKKNSDNKNVETLIDTACIAIDERNGKVNIENCVYYHTLVNPSGSIQSKTGIASTTTTTPISGPDHTTTKTMHTETYTVAVSLIPTNIQMFYFAVFASQQQQYLTDDNILSSVTMRIINSDTKIGICAYTLFEHLHPTENSTHHMNNNKATAIVLAQFVRHPNMEQNPNDRRTDIWTIQPVPPSKTTNKHETLLATYDTGRDFGTILPELKQLVSESKIVPNMIHQHTNGELRMGLVRKGGVIRINDYIHQQQHPSHEDSSTAAVSGDEHGWNFACRWENSSIHTVNQQRQIQQPQPEPALKYEMHALLFSGEDHMDFNFQCVEQININHPQSNLDQSVCLGDKMLDHEEFMSVRLLKLPKYVTVVAFTLQLQQAIPFPGVVGIGGSPPVAISSLRNHVNHQISFYIRHPITNQVIAKYQQPMQSTWLLQNATFVACLYRTKKSSLISSISAIPHNDVKNDDDDEWYFHVVDESVNQSTNVTTESARKIVEKLYSILHCNNNSGQTTATKIAEEEQELDIVL